MKQVHWQLPFGNIDGTKNYRIDIYAEGAPVGGIRKLTGGATPFTTDEDNSDDFFAPVRTQTGNITVVDTTGTLMADLMPSDNIDRPVRLIRVSDGAILWQGFLSCEAYSQPYTSRPTEITIPVNSVLAAMQSVQLPLDDAGFYTVGWLIMFLFQNMNSKTGMSPLASRYYIPSNSMPVLDKYIDTTVMFDLKQQDNENSTTYTPVGISLYDVMMRLCKYMGWTAREYGDVVYITEGTEDYVRGFVYISQTGRYENVIYAQAITKDMSTFDYRSTGHQVELRQGAKSVEVVASVARRDVNLSIPPCPVGDFTRKTAYLPVFDQGSYLSDYYYGAQIYASSNLTAHTIIEFGFMSCIRSMNNSVGHTDNTTYSGGTLSNVLQRMLINSASTTGLTPTYETATRSGANTRFYAGAFFGRLNAWSKTVTAVGGKEKYNPEDTVIEGEGTDMICTKPDPTDGIHCVFIPGAYSYGDVISDPVNDFDYSKTNPILKMRSIVYYHLSGGYINLQSSFTAFYRNPMEDHQSNIVKHATDVSSQWSVGATLRFGGKYYTGNTSNPWSDTPTQFRLTFQHSNIKSNWSESMSIDKMDGLLIPVLDNMVGELELQIWPDISKLMVGSSTDMIEMFFSSLNITHVDTEDDTDTDRSANHYYQLLGLNFSDEVSVQTDLASDLSNRPSPAILMNSETEPMTTLTYADGTTERPERHLLDRLATYYGQVRRKISLEGDRPTTPIPLVRVTGYDRKTYLPLSESRDWRTGVSTIRCFECPE